jgi:hypothetical protein
MPCPEPDPDGTPVRFVEQDVVFVGEQDGPPERDLKARLRELFVRSATVHAAFLAIVEYPGSNAHHIAVCVKTTVAEDPALVQEIGSVFRSLFGSHEHLDVLFLKEVQEAQIAGLCKPFFPDAPPPAPTGSPQGEKADFTPRMPAVDAPLDLEERFQRAWRIASGEESVPRSAARPEGQRHLVVVTPGRMIMIKPCPRPGAMPDSAVAAIEKIAPSSRLLSIAVIAFTDLRAVRESFVAAIPFAGYLLGLPYIGHTVLVFEGHPSALKAGCRGADLLIVDEGMIPVLQPDWLKAAWSVMRDPQVLVFGRRGSLKRIVKK